jgi:hypothetical protein
MGSTVRPGIVLAIALLTPALTCAMSSCSPDVSGSGGTGGQGGQGTPTPPRMFCSESFGNVRSRAASGNVGVELCPKDEICANNEEYFCCNLKTEPACAGLYGGTEDKLYCSYAGWERLPMAGPGKVCAPNETCALRKGGGCQTVCCDPTKDPGCGLPDKDCSS